MHGDPRPCNIFIRDSVGDGDPADTSVYFVDFDLAGPEGLVTYPAALDVGPNDLKSLYSAKLSAWPDGAGPGKPITRALDQAVLEMSLRAANVKTEVSSEDEL